MQNLADQKCHIATKKLMSRGGKEAQMSDDMSIRPQIPPNSEDLHRCGEYIGIYFNGEYNWIWIGRKCNGSHFNRKRDRIH